MPGDGKEWCDGPAKTSSGGDTSEELDAAMGASGNHWWMRSGGEKCGRHGDGELFLMFVCGSKRSVAVCVRSVYVCVRGNDRESKR